MKKIAVLIFCVLLGTAAFPQINVCIGQEVDSRVDSFFQSNFMVIQKQKGDSGLKDESLFLFLFMCLSGIDIEMNSGYALSFKKITRRDLKKWKKWYEFNKCKISWQSHIMEWDRIRNNRYLIKDFDELEKWGQELDEFYDRAEFEFLN